MEKTTAKKIKEHKITNNESYDSILNRILSSLDKRQLKAEAKEVKEAK